MNHKLLSTFLLSFTLILSSYAQNKPEAVIGKESKNPSEQINMEGFQNLLDANNVKGSILFLDLNKDAFYSNNFKWAETQRLPASTFKILNSIIALETGIVKSDSSVLKWDGKSRPMKIWEKDLTLKQAFHLSCVPCYQNIARNIGIEQMQRYTTEFNYGDLEITTANIDKFWLEGNSKISQFQQIEFLRQLHANRLQIAKHTVSVMKRMMVMESGSDYKVSGKTGWAVRKNENNGWFVGYIESENNTYFFATNIEPKSGFDKQRFLSSRKEVTIKAFRLLQSAEN